MTSTRKIGVLVGVLFILATGAGSLNVIAVNYAHKFLAGNQIDVLFFPIALQEIVFAGWLIVKGFNLPSGESIN